MNITITETNITLQTDDAASTYTVLTKPDIADYGNATIRPLVTTYHLRTETIWDRFGQCMQILSDQYGDDIHCGCYAMILSSLYAPLLSSSQAKNILFYGQETAGPFLAILQDFMTFLQAESSLVSLPRNPFVFSGLANGAWHGMIIDLDVCDSLQTVCDAISKTRQGGTILLYTSSDTSIDTSTGEAAQLLRHAVKTVFASCTLYLFTMNEELDSLVYPAAAETLVLAQTEGFPAQIQELKLITQHMEQGDNRPEDCLYAMELLVRAEQVLLASYDYLENPGLPVSANALKEAIMDCYIGQCDGINTSVYPERLHQTAQTFYEAIEMEFQC